MTSNPRIQIFIAFDQCFPMFLELGLFAETLVRKKRSFLQLFSLGYFYCISSTGNHRHDTPLDRAERALQNVIIHASLLMT